MHQKFLWQAVDIFCILHGRPRDTSIPILWTLFVFHTFKLQNFGQYFWISVKNQKLGLKNGNEMATDGNRKTSVWEYGLLKPIQIQVDFHKFLFPRE